MGEIITYLNADGNDSGENERLKMKRSGQLGHWSWCPWVSGRGWDPLCRRGDWLQRGVWQVHPVRAQGARMWGQVQGGGDTWLWRRRLWKFSSDYFNCAGEEGNKAMSREGEGYSREALGVRCEVPSGTVGERVDKGNRGRWPSIKWKHPWKLWAWI